MSTMANEQQPNDSRNSIWNLPPLHRNHIWSYDFIKRRTSDGRSYRVLNVIDEHTRVADVRVDLALERLEQRGHAHHAGDALVLERVAEGVGVELLEVVDGRAVKERHQEAPRC